MAIHHHDSADLEGAILFDFQAEGLDVHGPITTRIQDIVDVEGIDIAPPRAILYLNRQSQHHCPMDYLFDSHNTQNGSGESSISKSKLLASIFTAGLFFCNIDRLALCSTRFNIGLDFLSGKIS